MSRDSHDYLREVSYPAFFHEEQAPVWLGAVATALGRAAPGGGAACWCEIGCGQGFGATVLAAANPELRFTGIDVNAAHIAIARDRAADAGIDNVDFICADIRDPGPFDGSFDHIVSHGVMSWVGDEVRAAIAGFVGRHLAPGGIAAIQYMSEPGGAAFRAFHTVFRSVADRTDPVTEGLALLRAMRDAGGGFFQLHPHAGRTLDYLCDQPPEYVAHEYLNPTFRPLAFREIEALFAAEGLGWLGSATPIENIDAVSLPAEAGKVIAPVRDTVLRETLKDMARNQALRYDLFARPASSPGDAAHLALLRRAVWCLLPDAPPPGELSFQTRIGPVEGDARIYRPLLERLGKGPARFAELEAIPPFAGRPGLLNQALQTALWARIAHPVMPEHDAAPAARLNRLLLRAAGQGVHVPALAAPALGSGIAVNAQMLTALSRGEGAPDLRRIFALEGDDMHAEMETGSRIAAVNLR